MKRLLPTTLALATLLFVMGGCCITRPNIDYDNGNLKFGPTLSGRTSGFWGEDAKDNLVDYKHIGSIGFGGFVYYEFCEDYPDFGILSGLYFNQYGAKRDYGVDGSDFVIKERLSYFTVPFSATYRVYDNFRVEAGPELSFLLGAKQISKWR